MDLLTNPNVAYLLLLTFLWISMLAVLSPGSGILEIVALFALVLAGLGVYTNPVNWWALALLAFVALPLMVLVFKTRRMLFLGLAIAALVVSSAYLFQGEGWLPGVDPVLAVLASAASGIFFWIIVQKALEVRQINPPHDMLTLVGAVGEARTVIETEGTVYVGGELWTARSQERIAPGERVRVVQREGLTLQVEPLKRDPSSEGAGQPREQGIH
jgi:membrane-bound ClpP family serine protease